MDNMTANEVLADRVDRIDASLAKFKNEVRDHFEKQSDKCVEHGKTTHEHTIQINNVMEMVDTLGGNIRDLNNVLTTFINSFTKDMAIVSEKTSGTDKWKSALWDLLKGFIILAMGYLLAGGGK
jgi:DNA-binding ferritin-like protein (Dps family)